MRYGTALAAGMVLALSACASDDMKTDSTADEPIGTAEAQAPPADAVRVREDYYMVPIGAGDDGCERYSPWSANNPVTTAIYFRTPDGSFTLSRSEAGCGSDDG